ncbi:MAG: glycerol-3-phosphate acyltransferase [Clostridia bacterium]|nr:glycerol-3-phosphate acyltransferase [Clostridia bacterium]
MEWWKFLVLIVGSYLIGNIFFARIISKIKRYDISKSGSGNPGTMNMLRNLGLVVGLLTLVLDMLKGVIPALVGYYLFGGASAGVNAYIGLFTGGLSALVGNIFPIFYKFKGGKGAAVVYGMFFAAEPILGLIIFVFGILYLLVFDYASLLSFTMITIFTVYEAYSLGLMSGNGNIVISCLLFAIFFLVFFAHRKNIFRLLVGKENGVNFKGKLKEFKEKRLSKSKKEEIKQKEIG